MTPANWYPDPLGRYEQRYWDGMQWTANVSNAGVAGVDPAGAAAGPVVAHQQQVAPDRIQAQVQKAGAGAGAVAGGGTLLTEPVLVVNQKAKIIEVVTEFAVFDQAGNRIGSVRQVGQSAAKKMIRVLTSYDQFLTHKYEIAGADGVPLLVITRPAKVFKSTVLVANALGAEIGKIVQQNVFGKIRFSLEGGGYTYGSINAENWRAWNFSIKDHTETEVARITKTFEGVLKTAFTPADNYVIQIHKPLDDPLRSLVIAAALSVDTALKQDARGLN